MTVQEGPDISQWQRLWRCVSLVAVLAAVFKLFSLEGTVAPLPARAGRLEKAMGGARAAVEAARTRGSPTYCTPACNYP